MGSWNKTPLAMRAAALAERFISAMGINRRPAELMMLPADWNPDKVPQQAFVEIKYDGIHTGYRAGVDCFTREGVEFEACSHLLPSLRAIDAALGGAHVLFGEYVHADGFNGALADFKRGVGTGILVLFDAVALDVWEGRVPSPPLHRRKDALTRAWLSLDQDQRGATMLSKTSLFNGEAIDQIELVAGAMWANGEEGIIVKDANSPYERVKSSLWMKLKQTSTIDTPITGMTIKDGRLVSITVEATPGVQSKVGVGFSDSDRANPLRFVTGRMVELKHLGMTPKGALKSASFIRFRDDKGGK